MPRTDFRRLSLLLGACLIPWLASGDEEPPPFIHPGMLQSRADLDFMKQKVAAVEEPWKSAWEFLLRQSESSLEFKPQPFARVIRGPDPAKRVLINDLVCEGCGDCSKTSNCLSVVPVETEFGRKRAIDQSSCNKDFSCVEGFCPSFVTVHGGGLKKRSTGDLGEDGLPPLPEPAHPALDEPYGILVTGVGGTGVVTIGALLGMAAHLEGKGCTILDMTGLAQKGGAVYSHVRIAQRPEQIHAVRIAAGGATLLLGCDLVVSASADALSKLEPGHSRAIVNSHETIIGDFTRNPDLVFPTGALEQSIAAAAGAANVEFLDATRLATGLLAIRSRATSSCSAMPISAGWCHCRPRRSSARLR